MYEPFIFKSDFLPIQLGKIFTDYYSKYEANQYNIFRNKEFCENHKVLSEVEFLETHRAKPWDLINEILETFSSLPYRVNSPIGISRDQGFKIKLQHITRPTVHPEFSELSSGERVLMALVASIYKSSSDNYFPDVLLLDEIDASLHPSMVQNLLSVIANVFLNKKVKIVLVSHSPTTIALAPEESLFVMNLGGLDRIAKASKSYALEILTEGFATLESGLKLFDQVTHSKVTIITEGRNSRYILLALKLFGIGGVDVITDAENISGKDQLKTLYDFFVHIPHRNRVIFVWDCDGGKYGGLPAQNNTYAFAFQKTKKIKSVRRVLRIYFPRSCFMALQNQLSHQREVRLSFTKSIRQNLRR